MALLARAAHPLHPPGGMERAVYELARHLQARGVETTLFTRTRTEAGAFPGRVIEVPYGASGRHGSVLDRTLRYPPFAARLGAAVAALVRDRAIDVVDAQGLTALGYARQRRTDPSLTAPLVMNPQGMEEHRTRGLKRLALFRLRALSREAARLADRVVATDESTRADVTRLLGVAADKVVVLPNGVDPDALAAATPADPRTFAEGAVPALRGADLVLLSVGRLEAYKGFGDVQAALARLQAQGALPARWRWLVAGAGALPADASLAGHVVPLGRVPEALLHALYACADLFVHATRFEGSSLVTLEAMAHGTAVVATRAGGIPDKIADGETGRLVAPGDVPALAEAIAALARDPAARQRLGRAARQRVRERFTWPVLVDRTIALYEGLLRGRTA
ncbi:MAG: glycosyltransferase family 4 protein [Vicinamibacteria bacterium]